MAEDMLDTLNEAQRKAVQAVEGPVLVLAGPGSGKTKVLTHRVAHLIDNVGVDPYHILAVTFTNKAAREMKERLERLVGPGRSAALTVGTFHSLCTRFLRRDIVHLGRERDFAIYDSDDQDKLMRRVLRDLNLDEKRNPPRAIHASISSAKNELVGPDEYARLNRTPFDRIVVDCYRRYQALLRESNALDFDDLLVETVRLFQEHPEVLARYHERYRFLLVDEYQDTNRAQYLIVKLLAQGHRNLFVVGDSDQCLPEGTMVRTPVGEVPIEQISVGDKVISGAGRGTTALGTVQKVKARPYTGKLIRATLRNGRVLEATPNHMCFARLGVRSDVHYVYLMYRHDKGYRIGVAIGARSDGVRPDLITGLQVRCNQEHADKMWILRTCATRSEAIRYEQHFAFKYGIPTTIFHILGRGELNLSQEDINWLFDSIDTRENAARLFRDLGMYADYPHYRPSSLHSTNVPHHLTVHLTAFGGNSPSVQAPWYRHRVWINTSDKMLEQQVLHNGMMTRPGNRQTWRVERVYKELERTATFAEELAKAVGDADVARWAAFTTGDKFAFQPAAHLRPSMIVPMWKDGKIVDEEIVSVETVDYSGTVYDLDIEHLHNYIASSVALHNSVYGWRGADVRNILQFEDDYPDAQVILLEQNYRSTQGILDVAQAVINSGEKRRHAKNLWTENGEGVQVSLQEAYDQDEEARLVADEIMRLVSHGDDDGRRYELGECAIMYRTNAQSRALEEALLSRGLRYQIVGGIRFYERKEVKDALAYLRLALNPNDSVSLLRVINVPARGIGERTEEELGRWAAALSMPIFHALRELASDEGANVGATLAKPSFATRTRSALLRFLALLEELLEARNRLSLVELLDMALERLEFHDYLLREHGPDEGEDRWNNVQELRTVAGEYAGLPREAQLPTFLEEVALVADVDSMDKQTDVITCITLHQAKGLEYPAVFLVGLEEGLLPHSRSTDDRDKLEEERRLLYVGATRAKQRLYLLYAFRRTSYGRTNTSVPSRFLADIPRALIRQQPKRERAPINQSSMFSQRSDYGAGRNAPPSRNAPPAARGPRPAAAPAQASFTPGMRVRHATFGDGIVLSSKPIEGDEEVTVAFEQKGQRRLLASFANLKKL